MKPTHHNSTSHRHGSLSEELAPRISVRAILVSLALSTLGGCATGKETRFGWPSEGQDSGAKVDSAAYHMDTFTFRKEQNVRPENDFMFYFKHCSLDDQKTFYSKTSYWCTDP